MHSIHSLFIHPMNILGEKSYVDLAFGRLDTDSAMISYEIYSTYFIDLFGFATVATRSERHVKAQICSGDVYNPYA